MLHILLAEDNRGDVLLIRQALDEYSVAHTLYVVHDGAEAIDFIHSMGAAATVPCPDLMILDLNLPKADGQQVLSEFRRREECVDTPVVVISSSDAPRDKARMAELGVASYFRKPSDLDEFLKLGAVVRDIVGPGEASRTFTGRG